MIFAISVAILAAGISLGGMAIVVEQKWLWVVGMFLGSVGLVGILWGLISMLA